MLGVEGVDEEGWVVLGEVDCYEEGRWWLSVEGVEFDLCWGCGGEIWWVFWVVGGKSLEEVCLGGGGGLYKWV